MFRTDLLSIISSLYIVHTTTYICKLQFDYSVHVYTLVILPTFKIPA